MRHLNLSGILTLISLAIASSTCFGQGWTGDVATVTPAASTIVFQQGLGSLSIQAASVTANTPIFFGPSPLVPVIPTLVPGTVFSIGRPFLSLAKTATLTLNYGPRSMPSGTVEASLRIYKLYNHKWTIVGGTVNTINKTVTTTITKAGTYALLASTANALNAEDLLIELSANVGGTGNIPGTIVDDWFSVTTDTLFSTGSRIVNKIGRSIDRTYPTFVSPAYNALFFTRKEPNGNFAIYSMNADGSHPYRLTDIASQYITNAAISGDGRTCCFSAYVSGAFNVYKMNTDGSGLVALATGLTSPNIEIGIPLALNPAGAQVSMGIGNTIRVVTVATGATVRTFTVAAAAIGVKGIAYNSSGTILAMTTDTGLYSATANSGAVTTRDATLSYGSAVAWSPDGTRIAVQYIHQIDVLRLSPKTWYDGAFTGNFDANTQFNLVWR